MSFSAYVALTVLYGLAIAPNAPQPSLAGYPASIAIDSARDVHRLVLVQTRSDGVSIDVTSKAMFTCEPDGLVTFENGMVVGRANGEGVLTGNVDGASVKIPVTVSGFASDPPLSFRNDVMPVFMRAGCNAGACHGSASGKNGFHLSLFGYDPDKDFLSLTREVDGRRINPADPGSSLLLAKPSLAVDHEGGERFTSDSDLYRTIERWIKEGARDDSGPAPELTEIDILPPSVVLEGSDATMQFVVIGRYSDGSDRDVSDLAVLSAEDDSVVSIAAGGAAKSGRPGETYLMARYGNYAVVSQAIAVPDGSAAPAPPAEPANYIDELVYAKHALLRIRAAEPCSDETFVRRVYIDLLGLLPTAEETRAFLTDDSLDKREKLIDRLLDRPEFNDVWAMTWAELLRVRSSNETLDPKGMYRYNDWLREAFRENHPIDDIARELLTATGGNFAEPAANFYLIDREPTTTAENVAQVFMGVQIKCAQCHNHPFDRWTMDDYYSFSAFFAQVGRKQSSDPRETIVFNSGSGDVTNLRDRKVAEPKFLGGEAPAIQGRDRREVLAEWLTSDQNPWFARNIANRVWARFMGQGIVEPVDDVRVSNPPSNPVLLEELSRRLIEYDYDLRRLIRDICTSNTYQMATTPHPTAVDDLRNFASAPVRRLQAETLLDAICQVTGTHVKFNALPLGARAAEIANGPSGNYFLEAFGRPARDTTCTCERRDEPTLAQVLHLINGNTISEAVAAEDGRVAEVIQQELSPEQVVDDLYLAALSRRPTENERADLTAYIDSSADKRRAIEDVYWSVLNSNEFVFNH